MSASHAKGALVGGWSHEPLASVLLRTTGLARSGRGTAIASLSRFLEFFKSAANKGSRPLARTDGSDESPEEPPSSTIWDDPSFWILMMH